MVTTYPVSWFDLGRRPGSRGSPEAGGPLPVCTFPLPLRGQGCTSHRPGSTGLGTGSVEEPLVSVLYNPTSSQPGWWLLPGAPLPSSPDIQKWALARLLPGFLGPSPLLPRFRPSLVKVIWILSGRLRPRGPAPWPARGVKRPGLLLSPVAQVGSSQGSRASRHLPRWAGPLSPRARSAAGRQSVVLGPGQEGRQPCPHRAQRPPRTQTPAGPRRPHRARAAWAFTLGPQTAPARGWEVSTAGKKELPFLPRNCLYF